MTRHTTLGPRWLLAASAAAALALTAGCSGSGPGSGSNSSGTTGSSSPATKTEITFSYLWGGVEGEALEKLIASFNASQSAIVVKGVSNPDMQKQLASMSSKEGTFDISDGFGNGVGSWASKGVLAPLDEIIADTKIDTGDFVPAALNQMKYDGKTYSLPIAVHTFQLLYNKKLLADAGIQPPTTMAELAAANAKLTTVDASGNITRLGLGNPDMATTMTTFAYAFGGTWDGKDAANPAPSPEEPGNVAALTWWQDTFTKKYGADKITRFKAGWGQYMSAQDPFYTGKVAMIVDGEWQAVNAPKTVPNFQFGVTAIPVGDGGGAGAGQLAASTLFIPANSQHQKEAGVFLAWLVDKPQMLTFAKALGNLPARTSLAGDGDLAAIPNFAAYLDSLKSPNLHALSSAPYAAQYSTDLGAAFDAVATGKASPADALAKVAQQAKGYDK